MPSSNGLKTKAQTMGLSLVANEINKESNELYQGSVEHLGGFAPFIYTDAGGGLKDKPFIVNNCVVI